MADQKIGGGYIEVSAQGVEKTQAQVEALEKDVYELADTYEVLESEMEKVEAVTSRLGRANQGFDFATLQIDASMKRTTETSKGFGASLGNMRQQITAASFAFQDFTSTSGDLGAKLNSVTNNLPMLLAGLGGLGQVISLTATAGIALYRNWDQIARQFETQVPFPKAAKDVAGLKDELKQAKKEMEELGGNSKLTLSELERYNELRTKTADIEARITKEKAEQKKLEKLNALEGGEESKETKARAKALQAGLGGQQDEIIRAVARGLNEGNEKRRQALEKQYADLTAKANNTTGDEQVAALRQLGTVKKQLAAIPQAEDRTNEAAKLVADAVIDADVQSFRKLENIMIDFPRLFTDAQRKVVKEASPEEAAAWKKWNEEAEEQERFLDRFEKDWQLGKGLTEQGHEYELLSVKEKQDQEKKAKAAAKKLAAASTKAHITRQIEAENRSIAAGGYVEKAEALLAQTRAAGGAMVNGRFRKMNEDQILDYVNAQIQKELHRVIGFSQFGQQVRANAGMNKERTEEMATVITSRANTDLQKRLTEMGADSVNNTQALLGITQQLIGAVGNLQNQQARLRLGIAEAQRQTRVLQRTALSRPGG